MSALDTAKEVARIFAEVEPAVEPLIEKVIGLFQQRHPELVEPPPPDGEAKIDAEIDAEIVASKR